MKIGVFDHFDGDGGKLFDLYEWRLKLVEIYDRLGIDIYHLAEHHSTPLGLAPSPGIFLAAVAQRTKRLRFGPMVYTLSLHHPLRVMEEICMLDQMSGGRIELGLGRGVSPLETQYYGIDPKESRDRYVEVFDVLMKAFATKKLDHEGKFFRFKGTPVVMEPLQRPHPPLWYGAVGPEGVDWPAKNAMNVGTNALTPQVREITDRYRAQWAAEGHDPMAMPFVGMSRHIVIAETDAAALAIARRAYRRWYESFTYLWKLHDMAPISAAYPPEVEQSMEIGMSFVGSPATVRAELARAVETTGVNYLMLRFAFGDLTLAEAGRSVELFARDVRNGLPP